MNFRRAEFFKSKAQAAAEAIGFAEAKPQTEEEVGAKDANKLGQIVLAAIYSGKLRNLGEKALKDKARFLVRLVSEEFRCDEVAPSDIWLEPAGSNDISDHSAFVAEAASIALEPIGATTTPSSCCHCVIL